MTQKPKETCQSTCGEPKSNVNGSVVDWPPKYEQNSDQNSPHTAVSWIFGAADFSYCDLWNQNNEIYFPKYLNI